MQPVAGLDASYDLLTDEKAAAMVAEGIKVYAQCGWTGVEQPPNRVINLRVADQHGLLLLMYASLVPSHSGSYDVNMALSGMPADLMKKLVAVPIDVEIAGLTAAHVNNALVVTNRLGRLPVVYTSFGQWMNMGNPSVDAWLWDANWDGDPALIAKRGYGAFRGLVGKQYQGQHVDASGLTCDSNTFDLDVLQPGPTPPPPPPPPGPVKTHQIDVFSDGTIAVS